MHAHFMMVAVVLPFLASTGALAQDQSEVNELREQIQQLNQRLDEMEAAPAAASEPTLPAEASEPTASIEPIVSATNSNSLGANAFNPRITLIIDAKYRHLELDPETYQIGGFVPSGAEGVERGFGLGESELVFAANIDPYWAGFFTLALGDDEAVVEEAWIQNSGFVPGLVVKAGRFLSGIGYINQQHAHTWDFVDTPLIQRVLWGVAAGDDGFQLRYVAPTPLFLEFGLEGGRGANFPGGDRNTNGLNAGSAFVHLGGDVGFSSSYQIGASYRQTSADERKYEDVDSAGNDIENTFTNLDSNTWGVDFVWKWAPEGNSTIRNFKFQTEYYQREEDGQLEFDSTGASAAGTQSGPFSSDQGGWYAQTIYQFMPRWRVGLRYDQLDSGAINYGPISDGSISSDDLQLLREHTPERATIMVDFSSSEFARFRLQFAEDKSRFDETDYQFIFQYVVSLGAHGAHRF